MWLRIIQKSASSYCEGKLLDSGWIGVRDIGLSVGFERSSGGSRGGTCRCCFFVLSQPTSLYV